MEVFLENPILLAALIIFIICIIIGFFGDRYLKREGKIGKFLGEKNENDISSESNQDNFSNKESNINSVNEGVISGSNEVLDSNNENKASTFPDNIVKEDNNINNMF